MCKPFDWKLFEMLTLYFMQFQKPICNVTKVIALYEIELNTGNYV